MRISRTFLLIVSLAASLTAFGAGQPSNSNDDSCEIGITPAATLLIPYFEVDFTAPQGSAFTTLFTITNASPQPQIARATFWTDWGFAAYSFDIFLTGYDVASVNLYELFALGRLPATPVSSPGTFSESTNVNHALSMPIDCASRPSAVPPFVLTDLRRSSRPAAPPVSGFRAPARPARSSRSVRITERTLSATSPSTSSPRAARPCRHRPTTS